MQQDSKRSSTYKAKSEELKERWRELCADYLPVIAGDSLWRFSRSSAPDDPEQGWKLHLSATVLNGHLVLKRIAPLLINHGVLFKAPASLQDLGYLNSGLQYGYSQVGKIITVYPRTPEEAVRLARLLHRLTRRMTAPSIPFDLRFKPGSNVYYRYGAFKALEMERADGVRVPAMRDPQGNLVPDLREPGKAKPAWASDPFMERPTPPRSVDVENNPLKTTFRVFRALAQRGKGGVYQAVDLSVQPARMCLLKEGRKGGEISWDGRDGHWRVRHEKQVLSHLSKRGVAVPRVYGSFELSGNYYLATEFIDGEDLQTLLRRQERRLPLARVLRYGIQITNLIGQIHAAGWVWMDCKPSNLIVTKRGDLRPLDFEGACKVGKPDSISWSTPAFTPPERTTDDAMPGMLDDLFAFGVVIYLLITGRMPEASSALFPVKRLRPNVPAELCRLVSELLSPDPRSRPHMPDVKQRMQATMSRVSSEPLMRRRISSTTAVM